MGSRCDRPCQKGFYGFGCRQACPRYTGGKLQCHKGVQNTLLKHDVDKEMGYLKYYTPF